MKYYAESLKNPSRSLRTSLTEAEQRLWYRVRRKQIHDVQFYRQKPLFSFIVDFYCPAASLVIEIDGSQHFEEKNQEKDRMRDDLLTGFGLLVLRFDNRQVLLETEAVLTVINEVVKERKQNPPYPPFSKGGNRWRGMGNNKYRIITTTSCSHPLSVCPPTLKKGGRGDFLST